MISKRVGLMHKGQRAFGLLELMLALAISSIVTGGITMAIFQVVSANARNTNHMTAIGELQGAGYWISRDTQMAHTIVPSGASGFPLTLTWTEWNGTMHNVTYSMVGTELRRTEGNSVSVLAQHISAANCQLTNGVLTLRVTATVGGGSQGSVESRVYEAVSRPGA